MNPLRPHARPHRQTGFTLVEIVVAMAIFSLAVMGAIAMVRKGSELEIQGDHRRQARVLIQAAMEAPTYHYANFAGLPSGSTSSTLSLDPEDAQTLSATLRVDVSTEQIHAAGGTDIPYKLVTMTVSWQHPDGADSVQISKRLAQPE